MGHTAEDLAIRNGQHRCARIVQTQVGIEIFQVKLIKIELIETKQYNVKLIFSKFLTEFIIICFYYLFFIIIIITILLLSLLYCYYYY